MLYGINELSIIVTSLLAVAVGSIWYSPVLFLKPWLRAIGRDMSDMNMPERTLVFLAFCNFVLNLGLFTLLAVSMRVAEKVGVSLIELSAFYIAFAAAVVVTGALWEKRGPRFILITVGYLAVLILGGLHVIAFWPW